MSSTNKTTNLKLNKWIGTDRSAREDFNNDNDLIDKFAGEVTASLNEKANPSLLINGGFTVWQRGKSFSNISANTYTADRWNVATPNNDQTGVIVSKNRGMRIQNPNRKDFFVRYYFETDELVDFVLKKDLTMSVKLYNDDTIYTLTWNFNDSSADTSTGKEFAKLNLNIFYLKDRNALGLQVYSNEEEIEYEYIKLELGSVSTPFTPRPYAEELVLCKRYYQRAGNGIMGFIDAATNLLVTFQFETEMRIKPTITLIDADRNIALSNIKITSIMGYAGNTKGVQFIRLGCETNSFPQFRITYLDSNKDMLELDAEIY